MGMRVGKIFFLILLVIVMQLIFACGDDDDDDSSSPADDDATDDDAGTDDDVADDDVTDDDTQDDDTGDDDTGDDDTTAGGEVEVFLNGDDLVIRNNLVALVYHLTPGRYSIFGAERAAVIENAEAVVYSNVLVPKYKWRSSEMELVEWTSGDATNVLGAGMSITVTRHGDEKPTLKQTFTLLDNQSCVLFDGEVLNDTGARIKVGAIYLLDASTDGGALYFGADDDLRVLTNGYVNVLDFAVPLFPGNVPTISNWSTLIYNQKAKRSLLFGALSFAHSQPIFYNAPIMGGDGQQLQGVCQYDPARKLNNGKSQTTDTLVLDFRQDTPHEALELFGDRIKAWLNISTWLDRHPDIGVPVGWNSWSGSGSSGGYGTNINEDIIVANMDVANNELRKWGMNYFQIDDGWEPTIGDWWVNESRFPDHGEMNGIEWLLNRADEMGFIPGIWIEAFVADQNSQTLADHPEWFVDEILAGPLGITEKILDLSLPAAQDYLSEMIDTVHGWGAQWIKLDFAYRAVLSQGWHDSSLTRGEFYREGIKVMDETLGDDVFFLAVAINGWDYGLVDGLRQTLDTMPVWEGEADNPYTFIALFDNQGLKPMYRDCARRYWQQNRIWINHPDLIFFRAHADPKFPPLTLNESQTFATAVALQGGIVKIGDKIVDLQPVAIDTLRKVMPVYGEAGRPLDIMSREFPEIWSLPIPDFDEPYHVLGLLNWGINRDYTVLPYEFLDDTERTLTVDLAEAGLDPDKTYLAFEFWTQEFLGEVDDTFSLEVPARTPRVVALREDLGRPQFLGTNRHVLGGAKVVNSLTWDDDSQSLIGVQEGGIGTAFTPFTNQVSIYVPDGFSVDSTEINAPAGYDIQNEDISQNGSVLTITFDVVEIKAPKAGEMHPDITWVVAFE